MGGDETELTLAAVGFERHTKKYAAEDVSGRDGAGNAVVGAVRLIEPFYPKPGMAAAVWGGADVAHPFLAALVQPVGPGCGRGAVRFGGDARFLSGSTSAASRCPTRRPCAATDTCSKHTICAAVARGGAQAASGDVAEGRHRRNCRCHDHQRALQQFHRADTGKD
jgi:hypothetical protein